MVEAPPARAPRLSVVAASRNDDHGGRLRERMQVFVRALAAQTSRAGLACELVLVEWNPPADRPPLARALQWPRGTPGFQTRIVRVPAELHAALPRSERLPLFQMMAKNVGIRRARGDFILATNVDVLFSSALVEFMARELARGRMYRVDRYDVSREIPVHGSVDEQLEYCSQHVIRVCSRDAIESVSKQGDHRVLPPLGLLGRLSDWLQDAGLRRARFPSRLHTNACGDFTLLHRDHWHTLRGYPELTTFSMHLDSLLCHAAHHAGFEEQVIPDPARVYHIEHDIGSGFTPEGQQLMNRQVERMGIEQVSPEQFRRWAVEMRQRRAPIEFNDAAWGLGDADLEETRID